MLTLVTAVMLAFTPPATNIGRREAVLSLGLGALTASPLPAFAQRSSLVPKSSPESTASFKAFQLSKPGEETEAFKEAERKRLAAQAAQAAGKPRKVETAEEEMVRLGLRTMVQAQDAGFDECATWRGCNRK